MIKVTTLDKREIALNAELIERIESVPETVITLTSGKKILVADTLDEVMEKVITYKRKVAQQVCGA
ncbi:MAG: flagellar protein FlbD [Clostridia bacterium]|nr:flagellar protein FlbD [Clostridia bacterium]